MKTNRINILIVEDEPAIVDSLNLALHEIGLTTVSVSAVAPAWELLRANSPPQLTLLNLNLSDGSGLDLLKGIRNDPEMGTMPVIALTCRGLEEERIVGLDHGADDCIAKPFSPRELTARVKALLRRASPEHSPRLMRAGPISLDPVNGSVHVNDSRVDMALVEFKLLKFLLSHPDRVLSRGVIRDKVWGEQIAIDERTVDVHMMRLRKAVNDAERMIKTVHRRGYILATK